MFSFPQSYANIYMISNFVQYDFNQELIHLNSRGLSQSKLYVIKLYMIKLIIDLLDTKSGIPCFT